MVTADDIRVLAQAEEADAVLAVLDDDVTLCTGEQAARAQVVYTKDDLIAEYGQEITDVQAETLAAGLTAQLAG
ncbi:MAG TPA: hypothetical protein VFM54_01115 [Micromonosporaceae bacterium]|nr:hypothetical protein [Micromonosporaceae bacterium]